MWWRLFKIKMIFALLFIVVLGYIFIPIIVKASDDGKE
jgi:vesicle-associated membrane protein 7